MTDSSLFTYKTIGQFLEDNVKAAPNHPFLIYSDRDLRLSYSEFNNRVDLIAKGLLAIGIKRGDNFGIWARNVPDWLVYFFAVSKIGAVAVTINTFYKSHELAYVLKQSDIAGLALVDGYKGANYSYLDIVNELIPELKTCYRGRLKAESFPRLKNIIYMGPEKYRGMYNTNELLALGSHQQNSVLANAKENIVCDDVTNIQYTSGTTGFPKGVMLSHKNILNNGYYIGERQQMYDTDRVCIPVPLFHCFGIVLGIMAVLTHRATAVMIELFDPVDVLSAIEKEKATAVYGVPTMYIAEMTHPLFNKFDLSSLSKGIMSGTVCPEEWVHKAMNLMHIKKITIPYGLTEAGPVITMTDAEDAVDKRITTVGRAMPNIEVKLIHPETGDEVGNYTQGEICCRGYNVMKGYYNMPEETSRVLSSDGWLRSGDLAERDSEGYYRITGRLKDMIIRGGENIYPREIEEFYYTMPGIKDVQIVAGPSEKFGEVAIAFVILHENADVTVDDILHYGYKNIARFKVPEHVFIVNEFPLTASGKIQKYKLRELAVKLMQANQKLSIDHRGE